MGSAARMRVAAQICAEQNAKRPVIAVVSAMSKVTDLLLDSLRKGGSWGPGGSGRKSEAALYAAFRCLPRIAAGASSGSSLGWGPWVDYGIFSHRQRDDDVGRAASAFDR